MGEAQYRDSAPFEVCEVRDVEAPVVSARRHDHRRGLHAPAVAQVKHNRRFVQGEAHHFGGYHHSDTEFLRLDIRTASERLARNAGWKTEIVLDTSARSRLSTEGVRVEDDHRESLGCGVDRGREAGGSRADDRDVVGSVSFVNRHHSECASQFGLAWIFQNRAFRTHRQRQVRWIRAYCLTSSAASRSCVGSSN